MSRWSWYVPAPKQPVPEDGLSVDRFGITWWGEQWMAALRTMGLGYANRLPRGRSYARAGRVVDLQMGAGEATAGVVGTRRSPYAVSIRLKRLSRKQWEQVVQVLAGRARYTVALLQGQIPPEAAEALRDHGVDLFPCSRGDLETSCSCPDWANPCKHVAAVHYVVAAALDADPFLIFALRGLGRDALLSALAEARGMSPPTIEADEEETARPLAAWVEPDDEDEASFLGLDRPEPRLEFKVDPAGVDLAGLAGLGPPPLMLEDLPARLGRGIRAASRAAVALAAEDAEATDTSTDDAAVRRRVLSFLRGREGGATMLMMRSRLPDSKETLHRVVRAMRRDGVLVTSGRGAATRYTPAGTAAGRRNQRHGAVRKKAGAAKRPSGGPRRRGRKKRGRSPTRPTPETVLAVLESARRPLPLKEIGERLGHPVDHRLRNAVNAAREHGTVVMLGRRRGARYAAADDDGDSSS